MKEARYRPMRSAGALRQRTGTVKKKQCERRRGCALVTPASCRNLRHTAA
jgi:hypothetical protein